MLVVCEPALGRRLIEERQALGQDRLDEVWDGIYFMSPLANDEHQEIIGGLTAILQQVIGWKGLGKVRPGVNVSDREDDWTQNYRVPDVVVYFPDNPAQNRDTHWLGGPDFAVEVASAGDRAREKLGFYAKAGTRELLIIDRDPWALELYALRRKKLKLVGRSTLEGLETLESTVVPLIFRLVAGAARPAIEVRQPGQDEAWLV
jgi:Uma2 family endonuclease